MASVIEPPALTSAVAEAKAYLRVEGSYEDALIARLVQSAAALCEMFTGQWLLVREGSEIVPASAAWKRLRAGPVRAISGIDALPADGPESALAPSAYAIDIDANSEGWVRVLDAGAARRVRVRFEAGRAADWEGLPEPLRQGVVRLAAHLFTHRDDARGDAPPAAVTALWQPWRRLRLA
jgi:uncharacterized phiE125 gp8 family phage protein